MAAIAMRVKVHWLTGFLHDCIKVKNQLFTP